MDLDVFVLVAQRKLEPAEGAVIIERRRHARMKWPIIILRICFGVSCR